MCVCVVGIVQLNITDIAVFVTVRLPHLHIHFGDAAHGVSGKGTVRHIRRRSVSFLCVIVGVELVCLRSVIVEHDRHVIPDEPEIFE